MPTVKDWMDARREALAAIPNSTVRERVEFFNRHDCVKHGVNGSQDPDDYCAAKVNEMTPHELLCAISEAVEARLEQLLEEHGT